MKNCTSWAGIGHFVIVLNMGYNGQVPKGKKMCQLIMPFPKFIFCFHKKEILIFIVNFIMKDWMHLRNGRNRASRL